MKINELRTPCYVIDEGKLTENLLILNGVMQRTGARILLAQKAFSAFYEYPLIGRYLSGTTASGLFEARLAHEEMGKENHVFCPAFLPQEMDELVEICDHIVFNSVSQYLLHRDKIEKADKKISVGLRINPECSTQEGHEIYDPCAPGSRLGITREALDKAIKNGLDLSRIESGKSEMCCQLTEMSSLVDEVEKVHRIKMKDGVELIVSRPDNEIWISTDRNRVTQVLFNFLSNAIKNTKKGSISLRLVIEGEWIKLSVEDTGCGISKEKLPLIFNRFEKINDFVQGTGLGLPICKSIVERLGGRIEVESKPGEGSTFDLYLPYRQDQSEKSGKYNTMNNIVHKGGRKKILVAEDVEASYLQISAFLRKEYTLLWVSNGEEAVNSFLREKPDMVLMDIRMPVMNGIQATAKIRTYSDSVPIIAVTAYACCKESEQALQAGCNEVIAKPYPLEKLKEVIEAYL